jgi:hypothetical protein
VQHQLPQRHQPRIAHWPGPVDDRFDQRPAHAPSPEFGGQRRAAS